MDFTDCDSFLKKLLSRYTVQFSETRNNQTVRHIKICKKSQTIMKYHLLHKYLSKRMTKAAIHINRHKVQKLLYTFSGEKNI